MLQVCSGPRKVRLGCQQCLLPEMPLLVWKSQTTESLWPLHRWPQWTFWCLSEQAMCAVPESSVPFKGTAASLQCTDPSLMSVQWSGFSKGRCCVNWRNGRPPKVSKAAQLKFKLSGSKGHLFPLLQCYLPIYIFSFLSLKLFALSFILFGLLN